MEIITEYTYEDALALVGQIAESLAKRYQPVENDDIYQELSLYLWKYRERILPQGPRWINWELTRQGGKYCRKQRAEKLNLDDQYYYTLDDVELALDIFFTEDKTAWYNFRVPDDEAISFNQDGLDGAAMLIDMKRVWDRLPLNSQQALYLFYHEQLKYTEMLEIMDLASASSAARRVERAREDLLNALNRRVKPKEEWWEYEGPGARTAISNSQADYITRTERDG